MSTTDQLQALLGVWLTVLRQRSTATAREYNRVVRGFLQALGDDGVSDRAVTDWLDSLARLAPASRAHAISAVRSYLKFAKRRGLIPGNPEDLLVRPRVEITSMGRYLNADEVSQLLRAAQDLSSRHYGAVLVMVTTGIRVSELSGAQWRHLFRDPQGRLGLLVNGKGGKQRVVRVRDDVLQVLSEIRGSSDLSAADTSPLLPTRRGMAYSIRMLHKMVYQATRAAGISKGVSPHWLRHTNATLAASGGAPVYVIQQSLGHASISTSQRYIHWARGLADTTTDYLPA